MTADIVVRVTWAARGGVGAVLSFLSEKKRVVANITQSFSLAQFRDW